MGSPVAYPFHALRRVHRGEARAVHRLRAAFFGASCAEAAQRIAELTGHPARVVVRSRALAAQAEAFDRGPCVALETAHGRALIEVDAELALAVVGALAGGRALPRVARGRTVSPEVEGALAGVLQWLARSLGVEADVLLTAPPLRGDVLRVELGVELGVLRCRARLALEVPEVAARAQSDDVLARLGGTPLSARVVIGRRPCKAGLLARCGVGDAVVVDGVQLSGPCWLVIGGAAFDAELIEGHAGERRLRIGEPSTPLGASPDPPSAEQTVVLSALPEGDALAELELEVEVTLGHVTLPAAAWAACRVGDLLALDGDELAALHVGGRLFARGELVAIDGGVGLSIHQRIGQEPGG